MAINFKAFFSRVPWSKVLNVIPAIWDWWKARKTTPDPVPTPNPDPDDLEDPVVNTGTTTTQTQPLPPTISDPTTLDHVQIVPTYPSYTLREGKEIGVQVRLIKIMSDGTALRGGIDWMGKLTTKWVAELGGSLGDKAVIGSPDEKEDCVGVHILWGGHVYDMDGGASGNLHIRPTANPGNLRITVTHKEGDRTFGATRDIPIFRAPQV